MQKTGVKWCEVAREDYTPTRTANKRKTARRLLSTERSASGLGAKQGLTRQRERGWKFATSPSTCPVCKTENTSLQVRSDTCTQASSKAAIEFNVRSFEGIEVKPMQLLIMIDRHASLESLKPLPSGDKAAQNHVLKEYVMRWLRWLSHRSQDIFTTGQLENLRHASLRATARQAACVFDCSMKTKRMGKKVENMSVEQGKE